MLEDAAMFIAIEGEKIAYVKSFYNKETKVTKKTKETKEDESGQQHNHFTIEVRRMEEILHKPKHKPFDYQQSFCLEFDK
jgi:hypothetical protein